MGQVASDINPISVLAKAVASMCHDCTKFVLNSCESECDCCSCWKFGFHTYKVSDSDSDSEPSALCCGEYKIRRLQLDGCSCSRLIGPCCHDCIFSVPMQSHNASTNHHVLSKGGHDDAITKATSAGCAFGKGLSVERVVVA